MPGSPKSQFSSGCVEISDIRMVWRRPQLQTNLSSDEKFFMDIWGNLKVQCSSLSLNSVFYLAQEKLQKLKERGWAYQL